MNKQQQTVLNMAGFI
ncbi:Rop family plasmid primer RNA-binding protein, partial [Salmonella enterica subsp. enterica serovar Typhimurium]|nr:Rop family plasmid primer RNA-binding protein [Shigella boydii]MBJ4183601.1 Rop family plasmid primer RNA-binding protein [Salmonella enterica subsp. enterica serovar Typhimurium]